jgi:hypothetical protein
LQMRYGSETGNFSRGLPGARNEPLRRGARHR